MSLPVVLGDILQAVGQISHSILGAFLIQGTLIVLRALGQNRLQEATSIMACRTISKSCDESDAEREGCHHI
jgi:hypothetical protein